MFTLEEVSVAFMLLGLLLLAGKFIRRRSETLKSLFIPSSIVAGTIALLFGPEVLGSLVGRFGTDESPLATGLFPEAAQDVWSAIPGIFISIVFATLFLGKSLPNLREIWLRAGPQVIFGQTVAWGQYVVGILLALLVLTPVFGLHPMSGALLEIGFEGGHGTAAGLSGTFSELGFEEGADLALGLATVGVVMGVVIGTILVNWGVRSGRLEVLSDDGPDDEEKESLGELDTREGDAAGPERETQSVEPLSLHLGYVGLAVAVGWVLLQVLIYLEGISTVRLGAPDLMRHIPLFPLAMIGGILVQIAFDRLGATHLIDRRLINRISGAALDITIVSALATLSLSVLGDNLIPFLILALAGIVWNVGAFVFLASRLIPQHWFGRGIGDFGQSMGMTVTGLLLMRISDPKNESGALESFGYKQLMFEPVVGGGLFTAASLPLIAQFGPVTMLIVTAVIMVAWVVLGLLTFGRKAMES